MRDEGLRERKRLRKTDRRGSEGMRKATRREKKGGKEGERNAIRQNISERVED